MNQDNEPRQRRRPQLRGMILRNTAALPALVTLLNGVAGFASMHYATKAGLGNAAPSNLVLAAWLIFIAMVFDGLDGRLARLTRRSSDFGAQLDSLCDAISFGVAPAVLMVQTVWATLGLSTVAIDQHDAPLVGKVIMAIAVVYMACAILRLARFNTENTHDVLSHMYFKGLPSPGAAAAVAAVVLLYFTLVRPDEPGGTWNAVLAGCLVWALPALTFVVALLMVSRLRYPHLVNQLVVGKRPFAYIVKAIVVLVAAIMLREIALAATTVFFALSGPIWALRRLIRPAAAETAKPAPPTA